MHVRIDDDDSYMIFLQIFFSYTFYENVSMTETPQQTFISIKKGFKYLSIYIPSVSWILQS